MTRSVKVTHTHTHIVSFTGNQSFVCIVFSFHLIKLAFWDVVPSRQVSHLCNGKRATFLSFGVNSYINDRMFNFNTSKHGTKADTDHPIHGHTQSDAGHLLHHHTPQESAGKVVLRPGWGAHCTHTHTHTHTHTQSHRISALICYFSLSVSNSVEARQGNSLYTQSLNQCAIQLLFTVSQ